MGTIPSIQKYIKPAGNPWQLLVACNSNTHSSWDRDCLTLTKKTKEFNSRNPKNSLPFFPMADPWTWVPIPNAPTRKPSRHAEELRKKIALPTVCKSTLQTQINFEKEPVQHIRTSGTRNIWSSSSSRPPQGDSHEIQPQSQGNTRKGTPAPNSNATQGAHGQPQPPSEQSNHKNVVKVNNHSKKNKED